MQGIDSRIFFWIFKARLVIRVKLTKKYKCQNGKSFHLVNSELCSSYGLINKAITIGGSQVFIAVNRCHKHEDRYRSLLSDNIETNSGSPQSLLFNFWWLRLKKINRSNLVNVFRKTDWTWVQLPSSPQLKLRKAAVAELADALDLKSSCSDTVRVRFPPAALRWCQKV